MASYDNLPFLKLLTVANSGEQLAEEPRSGGRNARIDEYWYSEIVDDRISNQVSYEGNKKWHLCR